MITLLGLAIERYMESSVATMARCIQTYIVSIRRTLECKDVQRIELVFPDLTEGWLCTTADAYSMHRPNSIRSRRPWTLVTRFATTLICPRIVWLSVERYAIDRAHCLFISTLALLLVKRS